MGGWEKRPTGPRSQPTRLQSSRSTFSWRSFLNFFAFKEGMLDTPISALGGWPTVSARLCNRPEAEPHSPGNCHISHIIISVLQTCTDVACDTVQAAQRSHKETNHRSFLATVCAIGHNTTVPRQRSTSPDSTPERLTDLYRQLQAGMPLLRDIVQPETVEEEAAL